MLFWKYTLSGSHGFVVTGFVVGLMVGLAFFTGVWVQLMRKRIVANEEMYIKRIGKGTTIFKGYMF